MNSKTKIIVLHMKEIIYTVIFATLGILILCLLFFMFSGNRHSSVSDKKYTPGVYTSSFTLGNEDLELEVSVKGIYQTFISGKSFKSNWIDKIRSILRHQYMYLRVKLLQCACKIRNLICRNTSGHSQKNCFAF